MPLVSVIMPTYNTSPNMLHESIDSILDQSYEKLELIIIDDGSHNNGDYAYIRQNYKDQRIILIKNDVNSGVAVTLNKGIRKAQGKYIVRMDSDDIAEKNRIKQLVSYMEHNSDVILCGSYAKSFGAHRKSMRYPVNDPEIRAEMLFNNPFCHPTVIMRRKFLVDNQLFYPEGIANEDYAMWVQMSKYPEVKFHNIPRPLLNYRIHANQVTNINRKALNRDAIVYHMIALQNFGVTDLEESEIETFVKVVESSTKVEQKEIDIFVSVCRRIMSLLEQKESQINRVFFSCIGKYYKKAIIKQKMIHKNSDIIVDESMSKLKSNFSIDALYSIIRLL